MKFVTDVYGYAELIKNKSFEFGIIGEREPAFLLHLKWLYLFE